jgi:hypothetical protein
VGTGAATASTPGGSKPGRLDTPFPLVAGWSSDGGATFQKTDLPLTLPQIPGVSVGYGPARIASGPAGTVVIAPLAAAVTDPAALVPAGTDVGGGLVVSDDGIDALAPAPACPAGSTPLDKAGDPAKAKRDAVAGTPTKPDPAAPVAPPPEPAAAEVPIAKRIGGGGGACVAADGTVTGLDRKIVSHRTWDQLGVAPEALAALRHEPVAFYAAPGSTVFARVTLPVGVRADELLLEATDRGFTAVAGSFAGKSPATTVLASTDGRAWAASAGPAVSMGSAGSPGPTPSSAAMPTARSWLCGPGRGGRRPRSPMPSARTCATVRGPT